MGEEDCLFLDLVVPGGVGQSNSRMPVMVYIHGGAYIAGSRLDLIPTPLAVHGDVIVATINYRLGIFGFLFNGPGIITTIDAFIVLAYVAVLSQSSRRMNLNSVYI